MRKLTVVLVALMVVSIAQAKSYHLTLEQSIEIAKEKSYSMKRLKEDFTIAEQNLKSAKVKLRTHVNMDLTLPRYNEGVSTYTEDGITKYYMDKTMDYRGNLRITQPLPTNGNIYINTGVRAEDYLKNDRRDANMRNARLNLDVGFNQPIDALYGYNAVRSTIKRAELAHEQSSKSLKREELNLIYDVSRSYYNLLSLQKSSEISKLDLERQMEAFETSHKKYEAGLIREVDHLQMEVDLAEAQSRYDMSVLSQGANINSFKELLGLELNADISLSGDMSYRVITIDPEKAVELALKNRLEIRERDINIELQKINIKQQRSQRLPKGTIEGSIGRGSLTQLDEISFSEAFENAYSDFKRRPSFMLGFTLSIPIFDWGENKALVRAAEARLRQNVYQKEETERSIESEVRNLAASLSSTLKRLQLLEKNVLVAEKSFEITLQRFNDGEIDSQSLYLERNRLNTAYTSHLSAYITYQLALADIMRKTFYDFENEVAIL